MTGQRTIAETARVTVLDLAAMEAVAAVHRASGALRSRAERQVLGPHRLTWTTWVVLQIVSVWKEIETRHVASEAGISKSTLTGVVATLDKRGLIRRRVHPGDARRVLLAPTEAGAELVSHLLPKINAEETAMLDGIPREALGDLTETLRGLTERLEGRTLIDLRPASVGPAQPATVLASTGTPISAANPRVGGDPGASPGRGPQSALNERLDRPYQ